MHFKPIKDFLSYVEECHKALASLYHRLSLESTDDKVKLFLDFVRNKEQLSYLHLQEYTKVAPQSLLETWLDNMFDQSFPMKCEQMKLQEELSIDDVVALAMNFDIQLIELMQTAAFNSTTIEAEIALENLASQEEETLHQVIMASNEFEYM
ncbi:hypothetical protein [Psychromonas sp.]|uniref:hypothetical protein n=1 Tax=Psychromonas sp. TaxID=1884585 RepID=UPI003562B782